nr:MAG TPA: hypothetical protein [Caudoviricetes sp.]
MLSLTFEQKGRYQALTITPKQGSGFEPGHF